MGPSGIYEIVNTANGKRYIGSSVRFARRWEDHRRLLRKGKHHSIVLQHAWNKHGEAVFQFVPMMTVEDKQGLLLWEQRFLIALKPEYNIASDALAPMLGRKHSTEGLAKMSGSRRGKKRGPLSAEHRANISTSQIGNTRALGVKRSPETLIRMSIAGLRRASYERLMRFAWAGA